MRHAAEEPEVPKLLPVSVAILDRSGTIVGVNDAWKDFARRSGLKLPDSGIGASYLHYCGSERSGSLQLADELRDLLAGRRDLLTRIYPCHSPTERRWFFMLGLPLASGRRSGVALLHVNLTPLLTLSILTGEPQTAIRGMIDSSLLAGSVETSSLEALSAQLSAMVMAGSQPQSDHSTSKAGKTSSLASLSKRQLEVLGLMAEGKTNVEIARALSRSPHTIKLHVSAILRQLNVKSRTQAALLASRFLSSNSVAAAGKTPK